MKTTSNINVSIIGDMVTVYHVANTRLYNLNRNVTYWKLDFHYESRQGIILPASRHSSKCLRVQTLANPWIFRVGPYITD